MLACNRLMNLLGDFEAAKERDECAPSHSEAHTWTDPATGLFKLNTEAAAATNATGYGMVARDSVGDVLMSAGQKGFGNSRF